MLKTDTKEHYKMYKSGKQMVNAMLLSALIATGGLALNQTAKADTVESASSLPTVQTTVNSTAQATSQAVVNSAASSVAPVSQVSSTSSSVSSAAPVAQTSQPASTAAVNTFNVTQNNTLITNVTQSLVQTNQNNQAQNVQVSVQIINGGNVAKNQNDFTPEHPASLGFWSRVLASGSFDIDASQLVNGNQIKIATITQKPQYFDTIITTGTTPAYLNSKQIGQFQADKINNDTVQLSLALSTTVNAIGTQHISFNNVELAGIHANDFDVDWSKLHGSSVTYTDYVLAGNGLNSQFRVNYKLDPYTLLTNASATPAVSATGFTSGGWATISIVGLNLGFDDSQGFNGETKFIQSNGQDNSGIINTGDKIYGLYIHQPKNNTWIPAQSTSYLELHAPYVTADGKVSYDYGADPLSGNTEFNITNAGDGLSFNQLSAKNIEGISYSEQTNGDYIYCMRIPREKIRIDANKVKSALTKGIVFNAVDPSNQAIQNSVNFWNDNLKNMPTLSYVKADGYMADPTVASEINAELINIDGRQLNQPITMKAITLTTSSMASGQSAVKLHVINATNGADLKHLIHFVISLIN